MDKNRDRLTYRQIVPGTALAGALAYILLSYASGVTETSDMKAEWGPEQYAAAVSGLLGLIVGLGAVVGTATTAVKGTFDVGWYAGNAFMGIFTKRNK